jgi:hypothetical protein
MVQLLRAARSRAGLRAGRLSTDDKLTLCLLGFFVTIAFTLELYFIVYAQSIPERSDLIAEGFTLYGKADGAYAGIGDVNLPIALETINVFVTQPLNLLLAWAIVAKKRWRQPLQLTVSAYLVYSVVLYFWLQSVSGYEYMTDKSALAFLLLYGANLPWLAGYGYMAYRSFTAVLRRFT